MSDSDGKVRLRNLSDDLKTRIKRGEESEARLVKRRKTLEYVDEQLRRERGELETLRKMLEMTTVPIVEEAMIAQMSPVPVKE